MSDPILDATTVAEFVAAADAAYPLGLPLTFPDGTALAALWAVGVHVTQDPEPTVLYRAIGTYIAAGVTTTLAVDLVGTPAGGALRRRVSVHVHHRKEPSWPDRPAPRPGRRRAPSYRPAPRARP